MATAHSQTRPTANLSSHRKRESKKKKKNPNRLCDRKYEGSPCKRAFYLSLSLFPLVQALLHSHRMECCFSRVEPTRGWDASLLLILLLFSYTPITARRPSSELRECVRQHWSKTKEGKKRPKLGKKRGIRFSAALSLFELFFFCFRFVPCVIRWVVFVYWKGDRSYRHHKNDTLTHTNTVKKNVTRKKMQLLAVYHASKKTLSVHAAVGCSVLLSL